MANTTATGSGKVSVMHQSSISIEVTGNQGDSSNIVRLKPALGGAVETGTAAIKVSTNLPGYNLVIKDADEETALVSSTDDMYTIPAGLPEQGSSAWGYRVDDAEGWNMISTTSTLVKNRDTVPPEGGDITLVTFGVSLSSKQMEGTYTDEVLFIVAANDAPSVPPTPEEEPTLSNLAYMQDMTPEICARSTEHETKQLIDKRDGKRYWVAKLKDGNCWMVQNLDLDLKTTTTLTNEDTDLNSKTSWTPSSSTSTSVPSSLINPSSTTAYSLDVGRYVLVTPEREVACDTPPVAGSTVTSGYDSVRTGQTFDLCSDFQKVDNWNSSWTTQNGTWNGYTGPVAADAATKTYDAHYLVGNYYQWNALTAESGLAQAANSASNTAGLTDPAKLQDAPDSICPKGWQLPKSGAYLVAGQGWPFDREKSMYQLLRAYGYPATGSIGTDPITQWVNDRGRIASKTSLTGGNKIRIDGAPLYIARTGRMVYDHGAIRAAGSMGTLWSSTLNARANYLANLAIMINRISSDTYTSASVAYGGMNMDDYAVNARCVAR